MGGKNPKKGKKLPQEGRGSALSDLEGVPKWKEGLETLKKDEKNVDKPQTNKVLPCRVASFVVKESFLWLGFKRPSTYQG